MTTVERFCDTHAYVRDDETTLGDPYAERDAIAERCAECQRLRGPLDRCVDCRCNPLTGCHDPLEDDHPAMCHDCHREYGEPDPECEDCQEANALMWERMMTAY